MATFNINLTDETSKKNLFKNTINYINKNKLIKYEKFKELLKRKKSEYGNDLLKEMLEYDYENSDSPLLNKFGIEIAEMEKIKYLLEIFPFSQQMKKDCLENYVDCDYDPDDHYDFLETFLKNANIEKDYLKDIDIRQFNDLKTILLLENYGYDIKNDDLYTCSIYPNNIELLEYLLKEKKLNPNHQSIRSNGWTPLHYAYQLLNDDEEDSEMIKMLLKYGANPNLKNDDEQLPKEVRMKKRRKFK